MAYFGFAFVAFALIGVQDVPALWFASIPAGLVLLVATRQHVIVTGTAIELHNVLRRHRIALAQVDHVSVLHSRGWHYGWRIRVHHGPEYADTFAFLNIAGFRLAGAAFDEPPGDAPAPVKELYAIISARRS